MAENLHEVARLKSERLTGTQAGMRFSVRASLGRGSRAAKPVNPTLIHPQQLSRDWGPPSSSLAHASGCDVSDDRVLKYALGKRVRYVRMSCHGPLLGPCLFESPVPLDKITFVDKNQLSYSTARSTPAESASKSATAPRSKDRRPCVELFF